MYNTSTADTAMADPSTANKTNDTARHTPLQPYDSRSCCTRQVLYERIEGHCARPTGDSYGRTTDAPAQRFNGAKLRATLEVG